MKLAIASMQSFYQEFVTADFLQQMLMSYQFVVEELPIAIEEMQEAQAELDSLRGGDRDGGIETGD